MVPRVRLDASRLLLPRVAGALLLRSPTYRAVARDEAASIQAGLVVVTTGVLEAAVRASVHGESAAESTALLYAVIAALIGWLVWVTIVFLIASRVFSVSVDFPSTARAIGFAHAPSLLYGLAALPGLVGWAGLVLVVTLAWFVAALAAAIAGLTDSPPGRTLAITGSALLAHEALHQALRLIGAMD